MDRLKGLAYCGLACCVCGENVSCAGCRNDGCQGRDWCKNRLCCIERGYSGCWECADFPCAGTMLDKPRIRAFAEFICIHGEQTMLDCLERNEKDGIVYHYKGQLVGDYDAADSMEAVMRLLLTGK